VKIFTASTINLNLHSSPYHEGVNPHGDYVNPRTFELAGCGAFQLMDHRALLPDLFRVGEELVCFSTLTEARRLIAYYGTHADERHAMAGRASQSPQGSYLRAAHAGDARSHLSARSSPVRRTSLRGKHRTTSADQSRGRCGTAAAVTTISTSNTYRLGNDHRTGESRPRNFVG
jgi:hypothetical protein